MVAVQGPKAIELVAGLTGVDASKLAYAMLLTAAWVSNA